MKFERDYFSEYGTAGQAYQQQLTNPASTNRIRELAALGVTTV